MIFTPALWESTSLQTYDKTTLMVYLTLRAYDFFEHHPPTEEDLVEKLHLPQATIKRTLGNLRKANLISANLEPLEEDFSKEHQKQEGTLDDLAEKLRKTQRIKELNNTIKSGVAGEVDKRSKKGTNYLLDKFKDFYNRKYQEDPVLAKIKALSQCKRLRTWCNEDIGRAEAVMKFAFMEFETIREMMNLEAPRLTLGLLSSAFFWQAAKDFAKNGFESYGNRYTGKGGNK